MKAEARDDVAGRLAEVAAVRAWVDSLRTVNALAVPSVRRPYWQLQPRGIILRSWTR